MEINTIIHCLDHAQLTGCLTCPHYMDLDGSIAGCRLHRVSEAKEIVRRYQKIEQILKDIPYGGDATVKRIQEVIEDGDDD